jgi:hypothetical protein
MGRGHGGQLLAVARETGGGPVRHDRGTKDGGARSACPREEDECGARTSSREERGRPGGPAEGHLAGWRGGEGRCAVAASKTGDGPNFKKNFFSNFN